MRESSDGAAEADLDADFRFEPGRAERLLMDAVDRSAVFESDAFVAACLEDATWEHQETELDLLSFDVFDTLLLRGEKSEIRRFWEIAQMVGMALDRDPRDVLVARLTATRATYRTSRLSNGYREGELADIYATLACLLALDESQVDKAVDMELEYELESLDPNPAAALLWERLGCANTVAISNMYMNEQQIARLIDHHGLHFIEQVYSSTERKLSKNDGRLLEAAAADRGVGPDATCLHVGDSLKSDFQPAKRLGWGALYWPIGPELADRRRADAVATLEEIEASGVLLGSLAAHFVENP